MSAIRKYVLLLALLAAAFLGAFATDDYAGRVHVDWLGYAVDSNVPFFLAAMLALYVIIAFVSKIIGAALFPGKHIENYRRRRLTSALAGLNSALLSGDVAKMERNLARLTKNFSERQYGLAHAVRAKISEERNKATEARNAYKQLCERGDYRLAAHRGLAHLEYVSGNLSEAAALTKKARGLGGEAPWIDRTEAAIFIEQKNWEKARESVARLASSPTSPYRRLCAVLSLLRAQELLRLDQKANALRVGHEAHKAAPDDPEITLLYGSLLQNAGEGGALEELVVKKWKDKPSVPLGRLLLRRNASEELSERDRKKRIERLCAAAPEAPESWLASAEAYADMERMAEARRALEQCQSLRPSAEAYALMAEIDEKQGASDRTAIGELRDKSRKAPALAETFSCPSCGLQNLYPELTCERCGAVNGPKCGV